MKAFTMWSTDERWYVCNREVNEEKYTCLSDVQSVVKKNQTYQYSSLLLLILLYEAVDALNGR
jgi:hypothetical protein